MNEPSPISPSFIEPETDDPVADADTRTTVRTVALVTLAVLAVFAALSTAAEVVVPLLLALMLKLMLQPAMRLLSERLRLPVRLSALLLIVALFGLVAGIGASIAVPASGWIAKAPQGLQTLQTQLSLLRGPLATVQDFVRQAEHLTEPAAGAGKGATNNPPVVATPSASGLTDVGISILLGTQHFFARLMVLVVTLFFMLAAGDSMLRNLVEAVPRFHDKKHVVWIANEIERNVSRYLGTITAINAAVGMLVGGAMSICGIGDPLLWGTVAFLLNFVPIVGPLVGIGMIYIVGLLTFGHLLPALLPAAVYLGVHLIEGQLVTPLLLARQFTLSPLIVIVSLFFWDWMWGIPGALLSVPLLAIIKIVCDRIPSLASFGHMLGVPNRDGAPRP
jgi:predicted PurR-regulated permease PerM